MLLDLVVRSIFEWIARESLIIAARWKSHGIDFTSKWKAIWNISIFISGTFLFKEEEENCIGGKGGDKHAKNLAQLQELGITHVLNVAFPECPNYFSENNIIYKTITLYDYPDQNILCHFNACFEFIGT